MLWMAGEIEIFLYVTVIDVIQEMRHVPPQNTAKFAL